MQWLIHAYRFTTANSISGIGTQNGMIWDWWYDLNGNLALQQINGLGGQTADPGRLCGSIYFNTLI